jgi:hypothetical protein
MSPMNRLYIGNALLLSLRTILLKFHSGFQLFQVFHNILHVSRRILGKLKCITVVFSPNLFKADVLDRCLKYADGE